MKPIVVLDLEWNGAYSKRIGGYLNEIIEFGAVRLDADLKPVDTFSALVRPQIGKKISDKIADLTSITEEELASGAPFMRVVSRFRHWAGDCLLMTWGTSDILALIENCRYFNADRHIPFLTDYVDAQAYCEAQMQYEAGKQMGLSTAAQRLGIDETAYGHHRALDDSRLTVRCLEAVYTGEESLKPFLQDARQEAFYDRMEFRTVLLCDLDNPLIHESDMTFACPSCGAEADRCEDWQMRNKAFHALFCCPKCQTRFYGRVQFKLKYEGLQVKKKIRPYVPPQEDSAAEGQEKTGGQHTMPDRIGSLQIHQNGEVVYLTAPDWEAQPWLRHAFSTRLGGISTGICATMNLGFGRGDDRETVLENYRRFCEAAGFSIESLCATAQVHRTAVRRVGRADRGAGILYPKPWSGIDSLITNEPGVTLCVYGADCVPLLFADPVHRAIGVAHAGWRGTVAGMALETLDAMHREFQTDAADVRVLIGPSIGPCCFEVDAPVAEAFCAFPDLDDPAIVEPRAGGKYHVDLWEANARLLQKAGVSHITKGNACTKCHPDLLWSHRATGGKRGAACGMLCIREGL